MKWGGQLEIRKLAARQAEFSWHPHFLLFPRHIGYEWVWLETVERKKNVHDGGGHTMGWKWWTYRLVDTYRHGIPPW